MKLKNKPNMKKFQLSLTILALIFFGSKAHTKNNEEKITTNIVISSAEKFYPKILSSYEKVKATEGSYLASKGFFDIKLNQELYNKSRGYYDGKTYDINLEKELGFMGSKVYVGYRKSYGDFPIYDGNKITNNEGEYRIGGKVSLLKDRGIDSTRLGVLLAQLGVEESKIQLELMKRTIQRDAIKSYWRWVVSGKTYQIYKDLYDFSLTRQNQLEQRMAKGDVAQIIVEENKKNILRRKNALISSQQEFKKNAISLSLYLRDETGSPKIPEENNIPEVEQEIKAHKIDSSKDISDALLRRPEIKLIDIQKKQKEEQSKYAKNLLQPKLDLEFEASKDDGKGTLTKSQSENLVNLKFSSPLQFREAKGKIASYDAELRTISFEKQLLQDQIKNEIETILININSLAEIYKNLTKEAELAELLEKSEREKFKHGASNFFLVNLREQDTAITKASKAEVLEKYYTTIADYELAIFSPNQQ